MGQQQKELSHADHRIHNLSSEMQTKATIEEMNQHLLKSDFAQFVHENEAVLSTKASLIITDGLQDRAQIIEEAILTESKRTDIAIRFVEWFTSRGEHYEHNLQILDKHLKDLVVSEKSPRVHTFFLPGNRMEFTPYKGPQPPSHLQKEK